jgi:hypothetical protein
MSAGDNDGEGESGAWWRLSWRQIFALGLIVGLLAQPASSALLAVFSGTVEVSGTVPLQANSGLTVKTDENLTSTSPFPASDTVRVEHADGAANYSSGSAVEATVEEANGTFSNVSDLDVTGGTLTINPDGMATASITGDASRFAFKGEATVDDGTVDVVVEGTRGTSDITLQTNGTQGQQYGLIDVETGRAIAVGIADATGEVTFSDVPLSKHKLSVEEAGSLTIREETPPHGKITGADVEVKFFETAERDVTIVNRSDSDGDGVIDLTGLPTDEEFVAQVDAPGHEPRTTIIDDIGQQDNVFLLNDSASPPPRDIRFVLTDQTGRFDSARTEIIIQRGINGSLFGGSEFKFRTVSGDTVGANSGYRTTLQEDERYRIIVRNTNGDTRNLGAFTPETSDVVELQINKVIDTNETAAETALDISRFNSSTTGGNQTIGIQYRDSENLTSQIFVEIFERNNESNTLLQNTSFTSGPYGTFSFSQDIPDSRNDTDFVVRFVAVRDGAENVQATIPLTDRRNLIPALPGWLTATGSVGLLWITAGLFSQLNGRIGGIVVAGEGALLWFFGLVPSGLGIGVVVLAMVTAGLLFVNDRNDGGL